MRETMSDCKRGLAQLWFASSGTIFLLFLLQSLLGKYGARVGEAWGWLLPTIMPTLSLIIGVLIADVFGQEKSDRLVDRFFYRLTLGLSVVYLLSVLLVILVQPLSSLTPYELMSQTSLWLGPFQGIVAAAIGAFFSREASAGGP